MEQLHPSGQYFMNTFWEGTATEAGSARGWPLSRLFPQEGDGNIMPEPGVDMVYLPREGHENDDPYMRVMENSENSGLLNARIAECNNPFKAAYAECGPGEGEGEVGWGQIDLADGTKAASLKLDARLYQSGSGIDSPRYDTFKLPARWSDYIQNNIENTSSVATISPNIDNKLYCMDKTTVIPNYEVSCDTPSVWIIYMHAQVFSHPGDGSPIEFDLQEKMTVVSYLDPWHPNLCTTSIIGNDHGSLPWNIGNDIGNSASSSIHVICNKILSDRTGKTVSAIDKDTNRDNFMSAEVALEYGLIDEIIKPQTKK